MTSLSIMADAFRVCDDKFESSLKVFFTQVVTELRAEQKQALLHLISGRDVFVNLLTGFGKSLIYQFAPSIVEEMSRLGGKIRSAVIRVISPLVSLMKDQVQCFERKGIKASFIGGGEELANLQKIFKGEMNIVYSSPEAVLKRELVRYKKTWVAYCMQRNMHSQSQVSAISWPSFLMEFGDYHIGQVIESAPYIASWSDVLKCIEIWRVNHAIEIWKILKKIFADLQDEPLPEIPDVETDIDGDEDDNDWMRILNDSFIDFSFTAMLEEEESMDVDASYEAAIPDILDNVLSSI